jgi:poly-gamma-glutamate capsule biosynthesis protein CapA/YwtB (metallophosphatase superfamily)
LYTLNNLESKFTVYWHSLLLILTIFLSGCQVNEPTSTPVVLLPAPNPSPTQPITATVMAPIMSAQTAVPTDTPALTPTPTSTPVPQISLAVPEQWQKRAELAVELLNQERGGADWQIVSSEMTADIVLVSETGHLLLGQEPIALAVPFTTDWEGTTSENAQAILSQGHELVTVMPWRELPPTLKALRIDGLFPTDNQYPLQEEWSLQISPGYKQAGAELQAALQQIGKDSVVHLVAVGDIMLDRSLGFALEKGNIEYPFEDVSLPLQAADLTIGNLESALGDIGVPAPKRYRFRAPPESAEALATAGFDILSLANNHALDFGQEVLLQGIELLQAKGIKTAGAGKNEDEAHKPIVVESNDLKLAVLAYVDVPVEATTGFDTATWTATENSPGIAWADPQQITADVQAAQLQSDLVIVLLHSGHEYVAAPSEPQILAAKTAVDAGADLVIGHHAHILQGIEYYKDGVIIYGTGNFAFEIDGDPQTALFHIWLDEDGVRQVEIQPAIIQFGGQTRLADETESAAIRSQVYYLTNLLNAK